MICVHTLVRNGEDYIKPCLESVLPYVDRALVMVDGRSNDSTIDILSDMTTKYKNLEVMVAPITCPETDLIKLRNEQIRHTKEQWVWIVDSDEYYPKQVVDEVLEAVNGPYDTLALNSWAVWDKEQYHVSTSKIPSGRVFLNNNLEWVGKFGKEMLYSGYIKLWDKDDPREGVKILESRYIHLTHIKKDSWRKEMGQERRADGRHLRSLPEGIIKELGKIYA